MDDRVQCGGITLYGSGMPDGQDITGGIARAADAVSFCGGKDACGRICDIDLHLFHPVAFDKGA